MKAPTDCDKWISVFGDDFGFVPTSTALPTKTRAGSAARVRVLGERIRLGQPLFVRGDTDGVAKYVDDLGGVRWIGDSKSGVEVSHCGRYQYREWRRWSDNPKKPYAVFIGASPSVATQSKMVRKSANMALHWGCSGFEMLNLFALKTPKPSGVLWDSEPIGDHNDRAIRLVTESASFVVCCWGMLGAHVDRGARVLWALKKRIDLNRLLVLGYTESRQSELTGRQVSHPITVLDCVQRNPVTISIEWSRVDFSDDSTAGDVPAVGGSSLFGEADGYDDGIDDAGGTCGGSPEGDARRSDAPNCGGCDGSAESLGSREESCCGT